VQQDKVDWEVYRADVQRQEDKFAKIMDMLTRIDEKIKIKLNGHD
jgi:hypothetical protein